MDFILAMIFGWPGIISALALSGAGILRQSVNLMIAGTLFSLPVAIFLSTQPATRLIGWLLPFTMAAAVLAVQRQRPRWAWAALAPFVGTALWLAFQLLRQGA